MSKFKSTFFPDLNIDPIVHEIQCAIPPDMTISDKPEVLSVKDVWYAGEKMLEMTINYKRPTLQPILVHFPRGSDVRARYLLQGLLGMQDMAASVGIRVPRPMMTNDPGYDDISRECLMMVKPPHFQPFEKVWPTLNKKQRRTVTLELASVMLKLYQYDAKKICTTRYLHPPTGDPYFDFSKLSMPALHQGPLESLPPQDSQLAVGHYFGILISRVVTALDRSKTDPYSAGWPGRPFLTEEDKVKILATCNKLYVLAPFHTGGYYIPQSLSPEAREHASKVLRQTKTGIHHDLDISRLLVNFENGKCQIAIGSGWEHAYHAPHWSVARMPNWLVPGTPDPRVSPITPAQKREMRKTIYGYMRRECPEWVICYTYAQSERFFEGLLKSHWSCRDAVEAGISILRKRWDGINAELGGPRFPLDDSGNFVSNSDPKWFNSYAVELDQRAGSGPGSGSGSGVKDGGKQVAEGSGAVSARPSTADQTKKARPMVPTQDLEIPVFCEGTPQELPPGTKVIQLQVTPPTPNLEAQLAEDIVEELVEAITGPDEPSPAEEPTIPEIFEAALEIASNSTTTSTPTSSSSDSSPPSSVSSPTPDSEEQPSAQKQTEEHKVATSSWFGGIAKKFFVKRPQGSSGRTQSLFGHRGSSKPKD